MIRRHEVKLVETMEHGFLKNQQALTFKEVREGSHCWKPFPKNLDNMKKKEKRWDLELRYLTKALSAPNLTDENREAINKKILQLLRNNTNSL